MLLPTSRAALVTFFAPRSSRVPALLNFSTGPASAQARLPRGGDLLVVTARRFVEKAKLEPLVAALASQVTIASEDLRAQIG